jgi:hypothetical protein
LPPTVAIADLRARAGEHGAGDKRIALADQSMFGERRIFRSRADAHAAVGLFGDITIQRGHVDERTRLLDVLAHQVDEIGAAAEIASARAYR